MAFNAELLFRLADVKQRAQQLQLQRDAMRRPSASDLLRESLVTSLGQVPANLGGALAKDYAIDRPAEARDRTFQMGRDKLAFDRSEMSDRNRFDREASRDSLGYERDRSLAEMRGRLDREVEGLRHTNDLARDVSRSEQEQAQKDAEFNREFNIPVGDAIEYGYRPPIAVDPMAEQFRTPYDLPGIPAPGPSEIPVRAGELEQRRLLRTQRTNEANVAADNRRLDLQQESLAKAREANAALNRDKLDYNKARDAAERQFDWERLAVEKVRDIAKQAHDDVQSAEAALSKFQVASLDYLTDEEKTNPMIVEAMSKVLQARANRDVANSHFTRRSFSSGVAPLPAGGPPAGGGPPPGGPPPATNPYIGKNILSLEREADQLPDGDPRLEQILEAIDALENGGR